MRVRQIVKGAVLLALAGIFGWGGEAPLKAAVLPGMASASGTVTASKPFKAAQVFFRHPQKRVTYLVYTGVGQYRVVDLFPGEYEVSARANWNELESDVQKITVKAGEAPTINIALHDGARGSYQQKMFGGPEPITYLTYDQMFPPGKGRDVLERTCMRCHGENHEPMNPGSADYWYNRVDVNMMGRDLWDRASTAYQEGVLNFRNTALRFSREDHKDLLDYFVKNFGPTATRRAVKTTKLTPYDEAALSKAEFIEYSLAPVPAGTGVKAPEYIQIGYRGRRVIQDPRFDAHGNVWGTDRAFPCQLVKLDPRTGEYKDFPMPEPTAEIHDLIVGREGVVWLPQHGGAVPYGPQRIWGFNSNTEKFQYAIDMDPDNYIRMPIKWMQSLGETSKGDIVASWFMGGALSIWHKAENKVTVHPMPMSNSMIYGTVIGKDDVAYSAEYTGKIEAFHTWTATANGVGEWVEYTPPKYPGQIRRPNVDYQGHVIYGEWGGGPIMPAVIGVLDPVTGKHTQFEIPEQVGQPYDEEPDPDGRRIWFADSPTPDRAAQIGVVDTRDGKFTFYPKPQFNADTPKIQITRDGAVWYAPRGSNEYPGMGALYPDKDKITTLGAYYLNGPPGYPFKPGAPPAASQSAKPAAKQSAALSKGQ
jgi:streptogramin lyase